MPDTAVPGLPRRSVALRAVCGLKPSFHYDRLINSEVIARGKGVYGLALVGWSRNSYMDIQGKVALVTGGASGLGAASVRTIVSAGGRAMILDLNEKAGQELANELGDAA